MGESERATTSPDADSVESSEMITIGEDGGATSSLGQDGSATREYGLVGIGSTCTGIGSGGAAALSDLSY